MRLYHGTKSVIFKLAGNKIDMGIDQLLALLKPYIKERSIKQFSGKVAAVDTYGWLHRIIKSQGSAGKDIIANKNKHRYVDQCMKRIRKLQREGLKLIMVFDGGPLPRKAAEQVMRKKKRQEYQQKGIEHLKEGNEQLGIRRLMDSIDVTPQVAYKLIIQLKKHNIQFIVAPYEADAQLAYLSRSGIADVIITEDSDLVVFGAKSILYKVDYMAMTGEELCIDQIRSGDSSYSFFTHCMFMTKCIMAGCDYLPQIPTVGIKTTYKCISRNGCLKKALLQLQSKGKEIPKNYQNDFVLAFLTFRFQRIYCPRQRKCIQINDLSVLDLSLQELEKSQKNKKWSEEILDSFILNYAREKTFNWQFLGPKIPDEVIIRIAEGQIDPTTLQPYKGNAFQDINYQQILPLLNNKDNLKDKKIQQNLKNGESTLHKFLQTGKLSKRSFQYKNICSQNGYTIVKDYDDEEKSNSIFQVKPLKNSNKNMLQIKEDDQQIQINCQDLSSNYEKQSFEQSSKVSAVSGPHKSLTQIANQMFSSIFSNEFLKSPFKYSRQKMSQ